MAKPIRRQTYRNTAYSIHVLGAPPSGLRDLYHALLRVPWWMMLLVIVCGYLLLNGVFALLYLWTGGIGNARHGSLLDAFSSACRPWAPSATGRCIRRTWRPIGSWSRSR